MSTTPLKSRTTATKEAPALKAAPWAASDRSPSDAALPMRSSEWVAAWASPRLVNGTAVSLVRRPLRVMILGIRGFPDVQGGVEKHAENLAIALAKLGCDVEAVVRTEYVPKKTQAWHGIRIVRLWNSRTKGVETFLHTFFGVLYAACRRPHILHIHGIGPAFFAPLARALGLRVVVTCHSLNYEHAKWGRFARAVLRAGEWAGMKFSHGRIAVSDGLAKQMSRIHGVTVHVIPNGLDKPSIIESTNVLKAFGLLPKRYALTVARIDEAKRQLDLIAAYASLREPTFKLALVGEADHFGHYARAVADAAARTAGVVMLGRQTGAALAELYTHAGVFVLPSSHEGQPIAVLEAASYGLPAILSDIPAHRELAIPSTRYIAVGDVGGLAHHLASFFAMSTIARLSPEHRDRLIASHDWDDVARRTIAVYLAARSQRSQSAKARRPF